MLARVVLKAAVDADEATVIECTERALCAAVLTLSERVGLRGMALSEAIMLACEEVSPLTCARILPALGTMTHDTPLVLCMPVLVTRAITTGQWCAVRAVAASLSPRYHAAAWRQARVVLSAYGGPFAAEYLAQTRAAFDIPAA